jgi:hypothetical protein
MADGGRLAHLLRWCGLALMAAGLLMVVATLLHPSRETATTIIASEVGLIAAHALYTLAWLLVLLGLPGLYVSERGSMGTAGIGRLPGCIFRHLSDCSRREVRVLCPRSGQGGAGSA